MKYILTVLPVLFVGWGCAQQDEVLSEEIEVESGEESVNQPSEIELYYATHRQDSLPGVSLGSVSQGSMKNSTVVPFSGENFIYFDTNSYLAGRAHTRPDLCAVITEAYAQMKSITAHRFVLMELSLPEGGKILPHRTHQNGLSADFMTPLLKDGKPYTALDLEGAPHYLLDFDDQGRWTDDPSVSIDFNLVAAHLLTLQETARKKHLKIAKVIWKMELKDELFATPKGKELEKSGIYITRNLTPLINRLHDDHYHVDFEPKP